MKRLYLLITILLFTSTFAEMGQQNYSLIVNSIEVYSPAIDDWIIDYNKCVEYLKFSEGWLDTVDYRLDGYPKIGYGHVIKKGENFQSVNQQIAEMYLKKDFNWNINAIMQLTDNKLDNPLRGKQLLAMACFCYNCGIGNFMKKIFPLIQKGKDIKWQMLQFVYYKDKRYKDAKRKTSNGLVKRRIWEYKLFNEK